VIHPLKNSNNIQLAIFMYLEIWCC